MNEVKLKPTWEELLGSSEKEYTEEERRNRWEEWKKLAIEHGDQDVVDYWSDHIICMCDIDVLPYN